ncbi:hypothetical protein [Streptomyces sp. NPDC056661]|uniref:hypothetical protein n=1 Tax=Streptomyces sp. NPDC056661 TaxID=3345898 RepID=UPI003699C184
MTPEEGALVCDEATGRAGEVTFVDGTNVVLQSGSHIWVAKAEELRPAGVLDQLRVKVTEINRRGRA